MESLSHSVIRTLLLCIVLLLSSCSSLMQPARVSPRQCQLDLTTPPIEGDLTRSLHLLWLSPQRQESYTAFMQQEDSLRSLVIFAALGNRVLIVRSDKGELFAQMNSMTPFPLSLEELMLALAIAFRDPVELSAVLTGCQIQVQADADPGGSATFYLDDQPLLRKEPISTASSKSVLLYYFVTGELLKVTLTPES